MSFSRIRYFDFVAPRTARQCAPRLSQTVHANENRVGLPDHDPFVAVNRPPSIARPEIFGAECSFGGFTEAATAPGARPTSTTGIATRTGVRGVRIEFAFATVRRAARPESSVQFLQVGQD